MEFHVDSTLSCIDRLFGEDVIEGLKDDNAKSFRIACNCLPACTTIVYDAEIDRAKFDLADLSTFKIPPDQYKEYTYFC